MKIIFIISLFAFSALLIVAQGNFFSQKNGFVTKTTVSMPADWQTAHTSVMSKKVTFLPHHPATISPLPVPSVSARQETPAPREPEKTDQKKLINDLENRLYEPGMNVTKLLALPNAKDLSEESRQELVVNIMRKLNSGELRPEDVLPDYRYQTGHARP